MRTIRLRFRVRLARRPWIHTGVRSIFQRLKPKLLLLTKSRSGQYLIGEQGPEILVVGVATGEPFRVEPRGDGQSPQRPRSR